MADFAVAGASVGGAAVTVTIPSGSDHVALMTWMYEDGGGSGTPSVPAGASVRALGTPGTLPSYFRGGAAYEITDLSPGSATFTPPSTGGNQVCIVVVVSGSSGIGDTVYENTWVENPAAITVDTDGEDDLVALVAIGPNGSPAVTAEGASTLWVTSALSAYSGRGAAVTAPRGGATTDIEFGWTGAMGAYAVQFMEAGGGGPVTGGSDAEVRVDAVGSGSKIAAGGSAATVAVAGVGSGSKASSSGADASVAVDVEGVGSKTGSSGASTSVEVASDGAGSKTGTSGSSAGVGVDPEGAGSKTGSAGAEAEVAVDAVGSGSKGASGGATAAVEVSAVGDGTGEEEEDAAFGGSDALVAVLAEGEGSKTARSPPADAVVAVDTTGFGSKSVSGGSASNVAVTVSSTGIPRPQGGSSTSIGVESSGAGIKVGLGGQTATVAVLAVGDGIQIEAESGGSDANVGVAAVGGGQKTVESGADAAVAVGATGSGFPGSAGGGSDARVEVAAVGAGEVFIGSGSWAFVLDGHVFYVLNDVNGHTYVCDLTTGQWHHWYTGDAPGQWNMYRGVIWRGKVIAGDSSDGVLWELDPDAMLDEGAFQIQRVVTAYQPVRGKGSVRQGSLRVTASVGEPTADPAVVRLRFTDDEGERWSVTHERTLDPGAFGQVLRFRSLGRLRAPGRIWEVSDRGGLVRIEGVDSDLEGT